MNQKNMFDKFFRVLFLMLFLFVFGMTSSAQSLQKLLAMSRARLNAINDYVALGTLKTNVTYLKVPSSKVTVYFRKPDQLKLKSETGVSFVPKGAASLNVSALLNEKDFDVIDGGEVQVDGKTLLLAKLLPKDENQQVIISSLYIDKTNGLVYKAKTTTRENGTYEVLFTYGKYKDKGLPDQIAFSFDARDYKLPKGITFDFDAGDAKKKASAAQQQKGTAVLILDSYKINAGVSDAVFK